MLGSSMRPLCHTRLTQQAFLTCLPRAHAVTTDHVPNPEKAAQLPASAAMVPSPSLSAHVPEASGRQSALNPRLPRPPGQLHPELSVAPPPPPPAGPLSPSSGRWLLLVPPPLSSWGSGLALPPGTRHGLFVTSAALSFGRAGVLVPLCLEFCGVV